jgi:acyl-CoA thioester hydrolase
VQPSKGFAELWRGVAYPWECDHMGHMNVQHHMVKAVEAAGWLQHRIGLAPATAGRERRGLVPSADYLRFHREVRAGDILLGRGAVLEVGDSGLRYALEMIDAATDEVCVTSHVTATHASMDTGEPIAWSAAERQGAMALTGEWSGDLAPRTPLPDSGLAERADIAADRRDGFVDSYRGLVHAWECDRFGLMTAAGFMARFSYAVWHVGAAVGVGPAFYRDGNVTAGLYYHLRYHRLVHAGDALEMVSALVEHSDRRHRFLHKLYDATSGALVASDDTMGINIDPQTRRPIPWPPEVAAKSRALQVKVTA